MLNLPPKVLDLIEPFASCFYGVSTWHKAQTLLVGAILTPGRRVVSDVLRVMGLGESPQFAQYHQVLNRAVWSPLSWVPILLKLLLHAFVPSEATLVFGIDSTIERRRGRKIAARGIYRDPVRSSQSHCLLGTWTTAQKRGPSAHAGPGPGTSQDRMEPRHVELV